MTKSRNGGYQRGKAYCSPTGARGRSPVAAKIGPAPGLHCGRIIQTRIGRDGFHSAGRLRFGLPVCARLAQQQCRQDKPSTADPGPVNRHTRRICTHMAIIVVGGRLSARRQVQSLPPSVIGPAGIPLCIPVQIGACHRPQPRIRFSRELLWEFSCCNNSHQQNMEFTVPTD